MQDKIKIFLETVKNMYSRPNYLIPLVTAQREFRVNNYQMGSAAQLEDLFFDSLGFFVAENLIDANAKRRTGKESWDYKFFDQAFSHKETLKGGFTYKWQPGNQDDKNKWHAKIKLAEFSEPVVLMFSNFKNKINVKASNHNFEVINFTFESMKLKNFQNSHLLLGIRDKNEILVKKIWENSIWKHLTLPDFVKLIGLQDLLNSDLWLINEDFKIAQSLLDNKIISDVNNLYSGLYIIELDQLKDIELIANNKAHSVSDDLAKVLITESIKRGNYLNIPLWPTVFANDTPPNLYQIQRIKYDAAMKPGGPRTI